MTHLYPAYQSLTANRKTHPDGEGRGEKIYPTQIEMERKLYVGVGHTEMLAVQLRTGERAQCLGLGLSRPARPESSLALSSVQGGFNKNFQISGLGVQIGLFVFGYINSWLLNVVRFPPNWLFLNS